MMKRTKIRCGNRFRVSSSSALPASPRISGGWLRAEVLTRALHLHNLRVMASALERALGAELLAKVNKGLADIKADGSYEKIYTQYFGAPPAAAAAAPATAASK